MWLQKSYECSQHTVGKKELKRWRSFLCGSSQQQFITKTGLWSWQLSFHSGGAGRVWHGEAGKTIEKRVLLVSWVDCLLLGMLPGSIFLLWNFREINLSPVEQTWERPQASTWDPSGPVTWRSGWSVCDLAGCSPWPRREGGGGCQHDPGKRRVMPVKSLTPGASSQSGHP